MAYSTSITETDTGGTVSAPQNMSNRQVAGGTNMVWRSPKLTNVITADSGSAIPLCNAYDVSALENLECDIYLKSDFTAARTLTLSVREGSSLATDGVNIDTTAYYLDHVPYLMGAAATGNQADFVAYLLAMTSAARYNTIRKRADFPCKYIQIIGTLSGGGLTSQTVYLQFNGQYK